MLIVILKFYELNPPLLVKNLRSTSAAMVFRSATSRRSNSSRYCIYLKSMYEFVYRYIYIYTYLCIYIYIQNYIDINIYIYILSGMHPQVSETIYSPDAEKYPGVNI